MSKKTNSYAPKATFTVEIVHGKRVFTAVNHRAQIVCKKNGKRSKLTLAQLKSSVGKGSYKFYAYKDNNTNWGAGAKLVPIKF